MIGKHAWKEMVLQVQDLEKQMQTNYETLAEQVSDTGLKALFVKLSQDEQQHASLIRALSSELTEE